MLAELAYAAILRDPATVGRPIERPGAVITNPAWIRRPQPDMPALPLILGLAGQVDMVCNVGPDGTIADCDTHADPEGVGFEEAARAAIPLARLRPRMVDGAGSMATVSFTVSFQPEELMRLPAYEGHEPSPELTTLVAGSMREATYVDAFGDLVVDRLSPDERVRLTPILRAAFIEHRRNWIDAQALAIARNLPESARATLAAGRYPDAPAEWNESAFDQVREIELRIYARARELYCASYACPWA